MFLTFNVQLFLESIFDYCILISFLISIFWKIYSKTKKNYFIIPFTLFVIYCSEKYGGYLALLGKPNFMVYNFLGSYLIFVYNVVIVNHFLIKKNKTLFIYINIFLLAFAIMDLLLLQGRKQFHTIVYGISSIVIIINCIYYFYEKFVFPTLDNLLHDFSFWFVTACFFLYTAGFPVFCLNNIYYTKVAEPIWPIIGSINYIINIIFYLLVIIGFLCNFKIKKYSL
jgi:hypothetical protein